MPENKFRLGIVIVNWNSGRALAQAVQSVSEQARTLPNLDWRGIVWDNGSSDDSLQSLGLPPPQWEIANSNLNSGFAMGNQLAIAKLSNRDWLLLLNPDAHLSEGALETLIQATYLQSDFAVLGPLLKSWPELSRIDGLGDVVHLSGFAWRDGFGQQDTVSKGLDEPYEVFTVSGAALLIRRDVFEQVGGFDEDFFCYQEDVDLGFRLRLKGHRALQVPQAVVYHVGSQSTGGHHSDFSVYHGRRNLVWSYVKNMPGLLLWLCLPLHLALNATELVYFTLHGQGGVVWRAKRDAMLGLPKMWRKRRAIQANRVATVSQIWRALDKRLWPWNFKSKRARSGRRFS